jgi:hypothetical protein
MAVFALMIEAASTSEVSRNFYHITRRNNPEDSHLQLLNQLRLKSPTDFMKLELV